MNTKLKQEIDKLDALDKEIERDWANQKAKCRRKTIKNFARTLPLGLLFILACSWCAATNHILVALILLVPAMIFLSGVLSAICHPEKNRELQAALVTQLKSVCEICGDDIKYILYFQRLLRETPKEIFDHEEEGFVDGGPGDRGRIYSTGTQAVYVDNPEYIALHKKVQEMLAKKGSIHEHDWQEVGNTVRVCRYKNCREVEVYVEYSRSDCTCNMQQGVCESCSTPSGWQVANDIAKQSVLKRLDEEEALKQEGFGHDEFGQDDVHCIGGAFGGR